MAKEMYEKKLQQELERQKEEDEQKRKIRKTKQGPIKEEPGLKKPQTSNRQVASLTCSLPRGESRGIHHGNQPINRHSCPLKN